MKKKIPDFQSEEEEFEFWSQADSTEYLEWSKAERAKLPNLTRTASGIEEANLKRATGGSPQ